MASDDQKMSDRNVQMIEDAKRLAGVAEAIAVYEAAASRSPQPQPTQPQVRFSTGANQ